jgi:hypothetical protein
MMCSTRDEQGADVGLIASTAKVLDNDANAPTSSYRDAFMKRGHLFFPRRWKRLTKVGHVGSQNVAVYYINHQAGTCEICLGYALGKDGVWFPHSWLWDGEHVIETYADPCVYFGVVLTQEEAFRFVRSLVGSPR